MGSKELLSRSSDTEMDDVIIELSIGSPMMSVMGTFRNRENRGKLRILLDGRAKIMIKHIFLELSLLLVLQSRVSSMEKLIS